MKVIAFNGSPHKMGNTASALELAKEQFESAGIEFEIFHVGTKPVAGCMGCGMCFKNKNEECIIKGDSVNEAIQKVKDADGVILASPVHYSGIAGNMKSFLDRLYYTCGANGNMMRHKVGSSLVAVRRSGGTATFDQLNHYLLISEMIVPASNYWNVIHGAAPGEIKEDGEGVQILNVMCENMIWMLRSLEYSREAVPPPQGRKKVMTNFVR